MEFMWFIDREKIKESEYIDKTVIFTGKRLESYNYTAINPKIRRIMRGKPSIVYKINATLHRERDGKIIPKEKFIWMDVSFNFELLCISISPTYKK